MARKARGHEGTKARKKFLVARGHVGTRARDHVRHEGTRARMARGTRARKARWHEIWKTLKEVMKLSFMPILS